VALTRRGTFFAPHKSTMPNGKVYPPYNRPYSIHYWLTHADIAEPVLVLIDPDMIFTRPIPGISLVAPGKPVSQIYDYMTSTSFETYKCRSCPAPNSYKRMDYAVGPPWMMAKEDWVRLMPTWIPVLGDIVELYPEMWIAEMVAYSVACAKLNLPHRGIMDGMKDNVDDFGKQYNGARFIDPPPALLHYCYTLEMGEIAPAEDKKPDQHARMLAQERDTHKPVTDWFHWSKYRVPSDWPGGKYPSKDNVMECESPLMYEFTSIESAVARGKKNQDIGPEVEQRWRRWHAFANLMLPMMNSALTTYKKRYCPLEDRKINLEKTIRTSHPGYWNSQYVIDAVDAQGEVTAFHSRNFTR
jgi:hypothetical protein